MLIGGDDLDRQHQANIFRIQSKKAMKASFGWDILAVIALILGSLTFAVIFIVIATFLVLASMAHESNANRLWPDSKEWEINDKD